jgi:hypothetical protein
MYLVLFTPRNAHAVQSRWLVYFRRRDTAFLRRFFLFIHVIVATTYQFKRDVENTKGQLESNKYQRHAKLLFALAHPLYDIKGNLVKGLSDLKYWYWMLSKCHLASSTLSLNSYAFN